MDIFDKILTVTEFNKVANEILGQYNFVVKGEVSDFKIIQNKWVLFELKDKTSKLSCFMMKFQLPFEVENGMEVQLRGVPGIYVPYGKFSFKVNKLLPLGQGALQKAFIALKEQFIKEGLFDEKYKKVLPEFSKNIGIITSRDAAAFTDIIRILKNRWSGLNIFLKSVNVQGVDSPVQIVKALEYFNKHKPVDAIILSRGGGSLQDLQSFNDEDVCRAVFASKIPVIAGVGHERDVTLVDFVADKRASTPSNAAEIVVKDKKEFIIMLDNKISILKNRLITKIDTQYDALDDFKMQLYNSLIIKLNKYKEKLVLQERMLNSLNPLKLFKQGYCVCYNKKGKRIKNVKDISVDENIKIRLAKAEVSVKINKINTL